MDGNLKGQDSTQYLLLGKRQIISKVYSFYEYTLHSIENDLKLYYLSNDDKQGDSEYIDIHNTSIRQDKVWISFEKKSIFYFAFCIPN